jgi:hypothetical protein
MRRSLFSIASMELYFSPWRAICPRYALPIITIVR